MGVVSTSQGRSIGRAVDALVAVLPASVEVRPARGSSGGLVVGGKRLVVVWAGEGNLGDVRSVLAGDGHPDVVVARQLSPGARNVLAEAGVGWVDETGAAEIVIGSIIVSRSGRPPEKSGKPTRWTRGVLAVCEALLCGTRGTVADMEEATGLSTGSCTMALRLLTDLGLLESSAARGRRSARVIGDRRALLDAYARAAGALRSPLHLQVGVSWRDHVGGVIDLGRRWDEAGLDWAATGAVAASVIAPYLATVAAAEVYVDANSMIGLEAAADRAGLRPIEGGRLTLRPFPTVAVQHLAEIIDHLRVAPWPRVYVDLLATGVRGEEAAEHLKEVIDVR